jgi:hypothetical protein
MMATVLLFCVIILFGLIWHDEVSGPPASRSSKKPGK